MAIYRNIHINFWEDAKVLDDMEINERYFMLYILTNPHSNQLGCYEISKTQIANETGFDKKAVNELLKKFEKELDIISYSNKTKELLIKNWSKYNWSKSPKVRTCIENEFNKIKSEEFRQILYDLLTKIYKKDTLSIEYNNSMQTVGIKEEEEKEEEKEKEQEEEEEKEGAKTPTSHLQIFNLSLSLFKNYNQTDLKKSSKRFFEFYENIKWKNVKDWRQKMKDWFEEDIKNKKIRKEESLDDRAQRLFGDN